MLKAFLLEHISNATGTVIICPELPGFSAKCLTKPEALFDLTRNLLRGRTCDTEFEQVHDNESYGVVEGIPLLVRRKFSCLHDIPAHIVRPNPLLQVDHQIVGMQSLHSVDPGHPVFSSMQLVLIAGVPHRARVLCFYGEYVELALMSNSSVFVRDETVRIAPDKL